MDRPRSSHRSLPGGISLRRPCVQISLALALILPLLSFGAHAILAQGSFFTVNLSSADSMIEGNTGSKVVNYVVLLSQRVGIGQSISIQMTTMPTAGSPATPGGVDYSALTTDLSFSPGDSQKSYPVTIIGDTIDELNEGIVIRATVTASNVAGIPVGYILDTVAMIIDDDNPTVQAISAPSATEGLNPTMDFVITLDKAGAAEDVTIAYQTVAGTGVGFATDGLDYTGTASGTLVIPKGSTTGTISIPVLDDLINEPAETFQLQLLDTLSLGVNTPFAQTFATGTITNRHNEAPTIGSGQTFSVPENSPAGTAVGTVSFDPTDGPAPTLSVTGGSGQALFSIDPSTGAITVAPGAILNFEATTSYTLDVTVSDGGASASTTITINITNVNDPPVIDVNGAASGIDGTAAFNENAPPVGITTPSLTVSDQDSTAITSVVVTITDLADATAEALDVTGGLPAGFTKVYDSATGTLTLSGPATALANITTLLQTLTYSNTSKDPGTSRTISLVATDDHTPGATSSPATKIVITITPNPDPPTVTPNTGLTLSEGGSANITSAQLAASDPDTAPASLVFTITSAPTKGQLRRDRFTLATGSTFTQADIDGGLINYAHDGSEPAAEGFAFTLSDGTTTLSGTFVITITPVNDAPVISLTIGPTNYQIGSASAIIDAGVTVTDSDSPTFNGGQLRVDITGGSSGDTLGVRSDGVDPGQIGVISNVIFFGGVNVGTISTSTNTTLLIVLNAAATPEVAQAIARNISFSTTTPPTSSGSPVATFTVSDGTLTSLPASKSIAFNHAPVAVDDVFIVTMNSSAEPMAALRNDSDPDQNTLTITAVTQGAHGVAAIGTAAANITYTPTTDYLGPDRFTYTISDGRGGSATATINLTVQKATLYLPVIMKPAYADLTVSFKVTPTAPVAGEQTSVEVTVTNIGDGPASNFWVDFYIDPTATPLVNDRWNDLCQPEGWPCYGLAWYYTGTLEPGQSVVLNSNQQSADNPNGYAPGYTVWPGYFYNGVTKLHAFVDTWNRDVSGEIRAPNGAIYESNESNNSAAQDITVEFGLLPAQAELNSIDRLPGRN
ncbi:MAG: cadherin-like domain-containing protein [Chloroflexales bacterium]